jgi:hypothetical protein
MEQRRESREKQFVTSLVGAMTRYRGARHWAEAVALPSLLLAISACGRLLGADEYGFAPRVNNPCGEDQVLTDEGICEPIGARDCGASFERGDFGCVATLPAEDCSASGGIAQLGSRNCGQLDPDTMCDVDGFAAPGNTQEFLVRYADADPGVPEEGTGLTKASPFRSIGGALASVAKEDPQGLMHLLLLLKGTFEEDVVIDRSNVEIRGCFGQAKLVGQETKQPTQLPGARCFPPRGEREGRRAALCVAPGQSKIKLEGLQISGSGDGIQVMGATVSLERVQIHDTDYFGMRISEVKASDSTGGGAAASTVKRAEVDLNQVAIYGAHGAAILVAGSRLTVVDSSIQHTRSLNDWANLEDSFGAASESARVPEHAKIGWARGISIHPGLYPDDGMSPEPVHFAQSEVTIRNSVITGHGEVALFAAGAAVTLDQVFVGATSSGAGSGRGLVAEQSLPVGKETTVSIDHSIIERASDAAVDVRDASVRLTHTTVRDTRGRVGDGCSGQGVRVRTFPTQDGLPSTLDVFDSSILGSRQAGVFSASSKVSLTRTLIRDVNIVPETEAACSRSMGDGIVLEGYRDQQPASLVLEHVRVENAARAAITWSGGPLSMRSTVLACNQRDLVDPTGLGQLADPREGVCGCGASWARCALRSEPLDSWVVSGPSGAWPDVTNDIAFCATNQTGDPINDGWASSFFSPEVAPSSRGSDGCTWIASSRREVPALLTWAPGYVGAIVFESPEKEFGFGAWLTLAQLATSRGRPTGLPLFITDAPPGSRLSAPGGETVDGLGEPLLDGKIPVSPIIVTAAIRVNEPGWHALEVSDLPAEFVCRGSDALGAHTHPNVRFGYAESGPSFTIIDFSDCRAPAP